MNYQKVFLLKIANRLLRKLKNAVFTLEIDTLLAEKFFIFIDIFSWKMVFDKYFQIEIADESTELLMTFLDRVKRFLSYFILCHLTKAKDNTVFKIRAFAKLANILALS